MTAAALAGAGLWGYRGARRRRRRIDLAGRVACITGGSRGLGFALAEELVGQGARVVLIARDTEELESARARLGTDRVRTYRLDVTDPAAAEAVVRDILGDEGRIDIVINNAGVVQVGPFEHMRQEDFERAMATHFWAALWLSRAVLPAMRAQGGGRIVNVASVGGRVAVPHLAPYCASKFALVGLSNALRAELASDRIFVTTVCPGLMHTGSYVQAELKGRHEREYRWFSHASKSSVLAREARASARQIVDACRHGDPSLTIGWSARLAILADTVMPGLSAGATQLADRGMPNHGGIEGDQPRRGWEIAGAARRDDPAVHELNQLPEA